MDSNNELNVLRARYAREIEDGKRIQGFTNTDEWNWYVDHVIYPTIDDYLEKILSCKLPEREDLMIRGAINALKMVAETTTTFQQAAERAKLQAKKLEEKVKNGQ